MIEKYIYFDLRTYIADYHENIAVLDELKKQLTLLEETLGQNMQTSMFDYLDDDWNKLIYQSMLKKQISECNTAKVGFETSYNSLSDTEKVVIDTLYFSHFQSCEEAEKSLYEKLNIRRTRIYEIRSSALEKFKTQLLMTGNISCNYMRINLKQFIKDYHENRAYYESFVEQYEEINDVGLTAINTETSGVQTSSSSGDSIGAVLQRKQELEKKIKEYKAYLVAFEEGYDHLTMSERIVIDEIFFKGHKAMKDAEAAIYERVAYERSRVYELRNSALRKFKRFAIGI